MVLILTSDDVLILRTSDDAKLRHAFRSAAEQKAGVESPAFLLHSVGAKLLRAGHDAVSTGVFAEIHTFVGQFEQGFTVRVAQLFFYFTHAGTADGEAEGNEVSITEHNVFPHGT